MRSRSASQSFPVQVPVREGIQLGALQDLPQGIQEGDEVGVFSILPGALERVFFFPFLVREFLEQEYTRMERFWDKFNLVDPCFGFSELVE